MGEIAKRFEVSEQTLHCWRNQFSGMTGEGMKHLKELERENARLKRLVADLASDKRMLKDLAEGNLSARSAIRSRRRRPRS